MKKSAQKKRRQRKLITYFFIFAALLLFAYTTRFVLYPLSQIPTCANSISCIKDLSGKPEKAATGIFDGKVVKVPQIASTLPRTKVLGESTSVDKHIYVDLTNQRLMAYEGSKLIYTFIISSGKWGRTPTGDFEVWVKLRSTRMTGGSKELGDYYDLPNVPYTMFFYNDKVPKSAGFGIHGAYWNPPFGHPSSHGCVNLKPDDAEALYNWASPASREWSNLATDDDPGTAVTIYGEAPSS